MGEYESEKKPYTRVFHAVTYFVFSWYISNIQKPLSVEKTFSVRSSYYKADVLTS